MPKMVLSERWKSRWLYPKDDIDGSSRRGAPRSFVSLHPLWSEDGWQQGGGEYGLTEKKKEVKSTPPPVVSCSCSPPLWSVRTNGHRKDKAEGGRSSLLHGLLVLLVGADVLAGLLPLLAPLALFVFVPPVAVALLAVMPPTAAAANGRRTTEVWRWRRKWDQRGTKRKEGVGRGRRWECGRSKGGKEEGEEENMGEQRGGRRFHSSVLCQEKLFLSNKLFWRKKCLRKKWLNRIDIVLFVPHFQCWIFNV